MSLETSMAILRTLGDPTRIRLLSALEDEELTVGELERVLDVPQSRVSTHLARLKEAGLALDRTDGPHRYYRMAAFDGSMPEEARATWFALRTPLERDPQLERDRTRRTQILAERDGQSWVDRVAGSLDRHYSPGRTWESVARALTLVCDLGDVADLGAGDGAIAELLAPCARSITGVDKSERMVDEGQKRLRRAHLKHVRLIAGDMHAVPLADESVDFVLSQQSLQYADDPAQVCKEIARILRPNGRALVVTVAAHKHAEVRKQFGHIHLGFSAAQLRGFLRGTSLQIVRTSSAGRERRPPQFEAIALLLQKGADT